MELLYNTKPMDYLVSLVKDLGLEIYKWQCSEDENSLPDHYLLLRDRISDSGVNYGDGVYKIRNADCSILLVSKGRAYNSTDEHNVYIDELLNIMDANKINCYAIDLGYDLANDISEFNISLEVPYYG